MRQLGLNRKTLSAHLVAGLSDGMAEIPDAMASGVLAGVSPVYGLYGIMIGTPIAALFTGSVVMSVVTTSAMAIAIGGVMDAYQGDQLIPALVTLSLVIGVVQLGAGKLRLGFLIRFISNAVMTGFLTGLSILIVLGQLGDLTGYHSPYPEKVRQAMDLLRNLREVQVETTLIGVLTILMIMLLSRTRVQNFALFIALLVAAVLVPVLHFSQVALVGAIPEGLPLPKIPHLILAPDLILGGIAIAIIFWCRARASARRTSIPTASTPTCRAISSGRASRTPSSGSFKACRSADRSRPPHSWWAPGRNRASPTSLPA
jgi:SulP family sulfate permease